MSDAPNMFSDGKAYEKMMGRWSRIVGASFLDWLAPASGQRWLDSGCGNGAFTEEIIARTAPASVDAVDPSEGQIAFARTRPATQLAKFAIGDAQNLAFLDDSFDVAIMALVIAFLPQPEKAAAEMRRVVRPGGLVATYMWDIEGTGTPLTPMADALTAMGLTPGVVPNPPASGLEAMRGFWGGAGLLEVETKVIGLTVRHASLDEFWDSNFVAVGPMGAMFAKMGKDEQQQLRARLAEQLPIASDGSIAYERFVNAVKGKVPH
ncbi:class I SAM-dependent methyltransferase [Devosia sp.]|uniref:class I SAM-dependent methyltransferase n=1 Tax=Devosia sp. TaxID=1871048 RepID=UPI003BA8D137